MMVADFNLQVWLETVPDTHPSVVIPYVKSDKSGKLEYALQAKKEGRGGSSQVSQSGGVQVVANQGTALSRFSISVSNEDKCQIELKFAENGKPVGTYNFDCPR